MNSYLILYYIVFLFISAFEYHRFKTIISPYTVLTLPFILVITFVNTVGQQLGFFTISNNSILLFNFFTLLLWIGGLLFYSKHQEFNKYIETKEQLKINSGYFTVMLYIGIASSLISLALSWNGLENFFNPDIENNYGKGVWGHLSIFGYPAVIMLMPILFVSKNKHLLILIIVFTLLSLFYQSKTRLFFMILGGIFHYLIITRKIYNAKKVLRQFFYLFLIGITIFLSVYLISFSALMGKENIGKVQVEYIITERFLNYMVGPVISCSEIFSVNYSFEEENFTRIFAVPHNILAFLSDKEFVRPIRGNFVPISNTFSDNAGTLMVYPYEAFGLIGTIIFMLLLGVFAYYIFIQALLKNRNVLLFSTIMTSLFLGFFGFFYHLLFFYEILLWGFLIPILLRITYKIIQLSI